jgi:predicted small lipoprotein YifL
MGRRGVLLWLLLAGLAACGKKGPLKRPDGSTGMRLDREKLKKKGRS